MKIKLPFPVLSLVCLFAITCAAAAQTSGGETFTHEEGGIQFVMPSGWTAEPDGDQLTVGPSDKSIAIVFWVPEGNTFDQAVEALDEELAKTIKNPKFDGDVKEGTHNGMPHASLSGSGTIEGEEVLFSVDMLMAKKPVIVLSFAAPDNFKKHVGAFEKLVNSIRKVG